MDESMDEKRMNFFINMCNNKKNYEKLNKRNRVETIYVGLF
jgi:hypothetical protein